MKAGTGGEEVSGGVGGEGEAEGLETLAEPGGAGLFAKGRSGDGGDGKLEVGDVALVAGEPFEKTVDARVGAEAFEIPGERGGVSAPGLPANPGTEWHGRMMVHEGGMEAASAHLHPTFAKGWRMWATCLFCSSIPQPARALPQNQRA